MPDRDGGSWNAMLSAYTQNGFAEKLLVLFVSMNKAGILANEISFASVLRSCGGELELGLARQVHGVIVKRGFCGNVILESSLVDVYGKWYTRTLQWEEALDFIFVMQKTTKDIDYVTVGLLLNVCAGLLDVEMGKQGSRNMRSARVWFYQMSQWRDRVSWNALLTSFARHGQSEHGKQTHGFMIRNGYEIDVVVRGALVDMYSKYRCLEYALRVFKEGPSTDVILWNSVFFGCCYNGRGRDVIELFNLMEKEGIKPGPHYLSGNFASLYI
ncbi:hypothetical protein Patl1_08199 [Pistacia atlantica]|uniref:Uncharacterized protein n=1 Tax=Pistacia atlantica TaxID=434234 RepID=A0ACC1AJ78_9ROSI|nr:hypothetical protein Patl1_08199 [Pistacia atlantica]